MHDDDDDWHRAPPPDRPPLPGEPSSHPTPNGSGNGRRSGRSDRGRSGPPTPSRRHLTGPTPVPFRGTRIDGDGPTIPWLRRAVTQALPRFGPALAFLIIPPLLTSARYWAGLGLAPGAIWRAGTIIRPVGLILLAIDLILSGVTIAAAHHLILGSHLGLTSGPGRSAGRVLGRLPAVLAATVPWSVAVVVARTAASSRNDSAAVVVPFALGLLVALWLGPRWSFAVFVASTSPPGTNPYTTSWSLTAGRAGLVLSRVLLFALIWAVVVTAANTVLFELWRAVSRPLPGAVIGFGYDAAAILVSGLFALVFISSLAELFLASGAEGEI